MNSKNDQVEIEVLSPVSAQSVDRGNAPRLDTLEGKTLCEVWTTGVYGGDRTFPMIRQMLQQEFPTLKIVPYSEFPLGKPKSSERWAPLDQVENILRSKGCDAVLLGNGG